MQKSLVVQSALEAFEDAKFLPSKQPILAFQRGFQGKLFDDIYRTLIAIEKEDDIFVSASGKVLGHHFELKTPDYLQWIEKYPNGVVWPITFAASTDAGKFSAPMRLLMMVPINNQQSHLEIPIALAKILNKDIWQDDAGKAVGNTASILLGMFANAAGEWEFGSALSWSFAMDDQITISKPLTVIHDIVKRLAQHKGIGFNDAAESMLKDYIFEEIGCVVLSGK